MTNEELLQHIIQQNQQILDRLDNYITREDLKEDLAPITEKVNSHEKFINGNGTKGARSRLDMLEDKVNTIISKLETTVKEVAKSVVGEMVKNLMIGLALAFGVPLILWGASVVLQAAIHGATPAP